MSIYPVDRPSANHAFSLVELSIVLVILGLLTGGILAGQSLIRAAELRSVSADYARFATSVQTFRDKYLRLPGDMNNATAFWGDDSINCGDVAVTDGTPGTCNGNADGQITFATGPNRPAEAFQFWKQLALAGLVEGTYSGLSGSGGAGHAVIGTNVPRGRLSNSGFTPSYFDNSGGSVADYAVNFRNQMTFGATNTGFDTSAAILKPEEAWNIDTKMDDGRPGNGSIIAAYWDDCSTSTSFSDFAGAYALNDSAIRCALRYRNFF